MKRPDAGNEAVNALYLAGYNQSSDRLKPPKDNHDQQLLRVWIRRKYKDKAWYRSESGEGGSSQVDSAPAARNQKKGSVRSDKPTRAKIPPKASPAPAVDLLGFDSSPPPAPSPAAPVPAQASAPSAAQSWDAFGGSSQQSHFNAAFDSQPQVAPSQQNVPAPPAQQQQQHGTFQANFGQVQAQTGSSAQQQNAQPQQQPTFSANFGQVPQQQQQAQMQQGQQQHSAFQANFGQMPQQQQPSTPQSNFGQMSQGQQQGQMPQGHQHGQTPQGQQQGQMTQGQQQPAFQSNFGQTLQQQQQPSQMQQGQQQLTPQQGQQQASFGQQNRAGGQVAGSAQHGQPQQVQGGLGQIQQQQGQQQQPMFNANFSQGQPAQQQVTPSTPQQQQQQQNGFANFGQAQMQQMPTSQQNGAVGPYPSQEQPVSQKQPALQHPSHQPNQVVQTQQPGQQQAAAQQQQQQQQPAPVSTNSMAHTMPEEPSKMPPPPPPPPEPTPQSEGEAPSMGMGISAGSSSVGNKVDDAFSSLSLEPSPLGQSMQQPTVGGQTKQTGSKFKEGQTALYSNSQHNRISVTIMKVHYDDDLEPYYTISLPDGKEKQTDDAHLALSDDSPSKPVEAQGQEMQPSSHASISSMPKDMSPEIEQIVALLRTFSPEQLQQAYKFLSQVKTQSNAQASSDPSQGLTPSRPMAAPSINHSASLGGNPSNSIAATQQQPQQVLPQMTQQSHSATMQRQQPMQAQQMPQVQLQQSALSQQFPSLPQNAQTYQPSMQQQQPSPQLQQVQGQQMMSSTPVSATTQMTTQAAVPNPPPGPHVAATQNNPVQKKEGNPFDKF